MLQETYFNKFCRKLDRLFLWKFNSDEYKVPKYVELTLHREGSIGWNIKDKCWVKGHFDGVKDKNGEYTKYIGVDLSSNPQSYELENHTQVIVCGNNSIYKNDIDETNWFSEMLHETDVSIYFQLINSRNIPMLVADTDAVKTGIINAFSQIKAGVPVVVASDVMSDVKSIDITDNTSIDRISSLDNFHEELIKRWCNSYGVDVTTKEKKAQVNEMELDSFGDYDTLNYLEMFEARMEFVKEMKEAGFDIEIVRNPIYWDEPDDTDVENGEFEKIEEEGEAKDEQETGEGGEDSNSDEDGKQTADDDK